MRVTIKTNHIYNIKTIRILTKNIDYTKDKWIGDYNCDIEKNNIKYIKRQLKL